MYLASVAIDGKLAISHQAFRSWRLLTIAERSVYVKRLAELINKNQLEIARLITSSMGKLSSESKREVDRCVRACETMPALAEQYLATQRVETHHEKSYVCYQPLGVILGITPWNFPLWQVIRFAIPNILAGNTVVVKHAPNVFICTEYLERLFLEAGFPAGVFQHFPVEDRDVEHVIRDDRVQGIALTGSARAGRAVAKIAGDALKKIVLELGGSDPLIVLEDADLDLAVKNACNARFMNAGQICVAAKRILVHEKIAAEFTQRFVKQASAYQLGHPEAEETTLSALARKDLCDNLDRQVRESVAMGAQVLVGGKRSLENECAYEATVLDQITPDMPVYNEEVFGPVSSVIHFASEQEAIAIANASSYGLGASIWTQDRIKGERMALQLECGMVYVNSLLRSDIRLPFGGIKQSGFGRELGEAGFREFTNIKTVVVN